jgi:hypothetical protein
MVNVFLFSIDDLDEYVLDFLYWGLTLCDWHHRI